MKQPEKNSTIKRIFKLIVVVLVSILVMLILVKLQRFVIGTVDLSHVVKPKVVEDPFKAYSTDISSAADGHHYVHFTNVIGNVKESIDGKKLFYDMSLTVETPNEKIAKKIQQDPDGAVKLVRDVLSDFRREDVASEAGRNYAKKRIRMALAAKYGDGSVDDIYLEKFLIQPY